MTVLSRLFIRPVALLLAGVLVPLSLAAQADQAPAPAPLEMRVLGSGGPGATGRAGAGYVLLLDGKPRVLVDAGPGTFARLGEAQLDVRDMDIVLLTHLHVDHVGELPGIVKARAVSARRDIGFQVYGPGAGTADKDDDGEPAAHFPSTRRFIEQQFDKEGIYSYVSDFAGKLTFQVTDLFADGASAEANATPRTIYSQDGLIIRAVKGHHRDAPAVIYRVDYKGKSITFSGDIDAHAHQALARISQGTQLLVFNAVVLDPPGSPAILYTLHTAPKDIGKLSSDAKVGSLLLSHLSPTLDAAREEVTQSIRQHYQGPLQFAEDGMRVQP